MSKILFPAAPKCNVIELVKVSEDYKVNVIKVLFSVFIFISGYLAILLLSVALIYLGFLLAGLIISLHTNWITGILAAGVMLVVIMFFIFIIKFFFKFKSDEDKTVIEITEAEHPKLFEFISKVCEETNAPLPKKIVVSPRVNASVFYNSSFLSMFFPVRKNLEIGLGLVNSVNLSEFKAIIAHEFGHFSQSSTRLGSYVYRFHKMIHNLLYDNDGWESALKSISSIHAILGVFSNVTISMVKLAINFLIVLHKIINKNYLALSREMEFHADSVAVSVSGSQTIINALYRIDFSQEAYNYTMQGIHNFDVNNVRYPRNFFELHKRNIQFLAKQNYLVLENGLPYINTDIAIENLLESRIQYKDIMASHPSIIEREKNANKILVSTDIINDSPWTLFSNPEKLQEKLSMNLEELIVSNNKIVSNEDLLLFFEKTEHEYEINPIYQDFYNYATNTYSCPQINSLSILEEVNNLRFQELFNHDITLKIKRYNKNLNDIELVKQIQEGNIEAKFFDFDNKQYSKKQASVVLEKLSNDVKEYTDWFEIHKENISNWFYVNAKNINPNLASNYFQIMEFRVSNIQNQKSIIELYDNLVQFYHTELTKNITEDDIESIRKKISEFYDIYLETKNKITEDNIPVLLYEMDVLVGSYNQSIFTKIIETPLNSSNLDGFVPFTNNIEELLVHWSKIDYKAFNSSIKIQNEILKQLMIL